MFSAGYMTELAQSTQVPCTYLTHHELGSNHTSTVTQSQVMFMFFCVV